MVINKSHVFLTNTLPRNVAIWEAGPKRNLVKPQQI